MQCFRNYNNIRIYRLREIEDILSNQMIKDDSCVIKQYKFHYSCFYLTNPINKILKARKQQSASNTQDDTSPSKDFEVGFHDIYMFILVLITAINAILIFSAYYIFWFY
jgi:hypothetical protein